MPLSTQTTMPIPQRSEETIANLTESKATIPTALAATREEIFLTPRVLDAGAFHEYTEKLQSLIRDLDDRSGRLSSTSADTDKLCRVLRLAADQLKSRADAGTTIVAELTEQTNKAEAFLNGMTSTLGDEAQLTRLAESVLEKKRVAFVRAFETSLAGIDTSVQRAEDRAAQAEARAMAAEQKLADLSKRLDAITEQAETIERRATESTQLAESRADQATSNALEAIEQLRLLAEDTQSSIGVDTDAFEERLGTLRDLIANASKILGSDESPGTLSGAIDRAQEQQACLTALHIDTSSNIEAAAQAHVTIVDTVNAAAESIESLEARRTTLTEGIEQDIEALSEELSPVEHAASALRRNIEQLVDRSQQLNAEADSIAQRLADATPTDDHVNRFKNATEGIMQNAFSQVEEAAEWLAALAAQACEPEPIKGPALKNDAEPES